MNIFEAFIETIIAIMWLACGIGFGVCMIFAIFSFTQGDLLYGFSSLVASVIFGTFATYLFHK